MYTITFYSFKGGVGRTMALVNVGLELVRRGRRVLLVDFDLEAPGLTTYEVLRQQAGQPGMVEYVTEYVRTRESPDISRFIHSVDLTSVQSRRNGRKSHKRLSGAGNGESTGRLWVMPAGKGDAAYGAALAAINWNSLYENLNGYLFFEDTKLQWQEAIEPDYILIDSRTGHTDVGGICTRQLADAVVLLFTPNEQNLAGLKIVCDDIRREETEGLKKTIRLHFVAANVPDLDDEKRILRRQIASFRKRLNFKGLSGVIRRYENLNLLDQSVFTLDRPHTRLARSYRRIVRTLLKNNLADREGAMIFLQDYPERFKERDAGEEGVYSGNPPPPLTAPPPASRPPAPSDIPISTCQLHPLDLHDDPSSGHLLVNRGGDGNRGGYCIAFWRDIYSLYWIGQSFKEDADILIKVAHCFILEQDFKSAIQMYDRVIRATPNHADALFHRSICKLNLGQVPEAANDLLACLRLPVSVDYPADVKLNDVGRAIFSGFIHQTALRKLHDIAPARMFDVANMLEEQGFQGPVDPVHVADFLCEKEEGVARAARLLREANLISSVPVQTLLRARCWKEVIQLHEAGNLEERSSSSMLELALAHWGEGGEMPESLCKQALDAWESEDPFTLVHQWGREAITLLHWRTGNLADAAELLENAEQRARVKIDDSFSHLEKEDKVFSVWRLRNVSIGQYLEDCQLMRRMFQGEPLRPTFLGPAGS